MRKIDGDYDDWTLLLWIKLDFRDRTTNSSTKINLTYQR